MPATAEISDAFTSVQGEGWSAFTPSVFLRFHRCNLACSWCDTKYTWDKNDPGYNDFETLDTDATAELLIKMRAEGLSDKMVGDIGRMYNQSSQILAEMEPQHLIITGGEPLIWRDYIMNLLPLIKPKFRHVEFETNGTIPPFPDSYNDEFDIYYNVSPKLAHAGNEGLRTTNPEIIQQFAKTGRAFFKFVIDKQDEQSDAQLGAYLMALHHMGVRKSRIWFMPLGQTVAELDEVVSHVKEMAEWFGVEYTDRHHIRLWGDERGM